ncbi:elongation factor Ts [bacterium]|nr:elongation factor Ts [bacterium]MBU1598709.1 elongation factor Ts [bacterium]
MNIDAHDVKTLREKTGVGMMECKKALVEAEGDIEKAITILRTQGMTSAKKFSVRAAKEGKIFSYIHHSGKIGILLELGCETSFSAKTPEFDSLGKELCLQITASSPLYIRRDEIPEDKLSKERDIYQKQLEGTNKPEQILEKIVDGKMEKFYQETCLLDQPYIRDPKITIEKLIAEKIGKIKENITPIRFVIFRQGE